MMHAAGVVSCVQPTIRNVPPDLDREPKAHAITLGTSVSLAAVEALAVAVDQPVRSRSLRGMAGAWSRGQAAEADRFLLQHRAIDEDLWK